MVLLAYASVYGDFLLYVLAQAQNLLQHRLCHDSRRQQHQAIAHMRA